MENQFDRTFSNELENDHKRPQFLTTLCILSFISIGIMSILSVYGLIMNTPERQLQSIEQMRIYSPATADQFEAQILEQQNSTLGKIQPYLNILFLVTSFFGVLQMFNLKRVGFHVYTLSELIPYIFVILGGKQTMAMMGSMGPGLESAAVAAMVLMVVFDLAFVIMYALNIKHMNK